MLGETILFGGLAKPAKDLYHLLLLTIMLLHPVFVIENISRTFGHRLGRNKEAILEGSNGCS